MKCPKCGGALTHDQFEDDYNCFPCNTFFYPEQLGVFEDLRAGYLTLNDSPRDRFFRVLNMEQRTGDDVV